MKDLKIQPTNKSLEIELASGKLLFAGCSIVSDPKSFFLPVAEWIEEYAENAPIDTEINIKLEYMDTSSVKSFFEILKKLTRINNTRNIIVHWYYEQFDPEILELGEILQSKLDFEFLFHEYSEEG